VVKIVVDMTMDEIRFEELDDILDELDDLEEIQETRDCSFGRLYAPIRSLFTSDSDLLDRFTECTNHADRLKLLVNLEVVKNCLSDISPLREVLNSDHSSLPPNKPTERLKPPQWKTPPTLSYGVNKKYPHLSKAVEVKTSAKEGRHMVAKQKILPGDVLIVDTAYTTSLFGNHYSSHCLTCMSRIVGTPVSCPGCDKVKFCSPECLALGYYSSHRWECPVLEYIDSEDIGRMATLAYRIVSLTGFNLLNGLNDESKKEPTYTDNDYFSVYHQEANMDQRPVGDHLKRCVTALILARCLQITGWFPQECCQDFESEEVLKITNILVMHIQSCACNAYEVNEFVKKGSSMVDCESVELGGAVYPTISLSNHACSANTSRTNFGTVGVVRATKTIFPNEKVWDNYGFFYQTEESNQRKQMLSSQYFFNCNCPPCKEGWPTYRELAGQDTDYCCPFCKHSLGSDVEKLKKCPRCKKELKGIGKTARQIGELQRDFRKIMDDISEDNAETHIKTFSALLVEMEKVMKMPCKEFITCQQVILQCYAVLGNSFKVELDPAACQLVSFTGKQDSDSSEDDFSDDDDMPALL